MKLRTMTSREAAIAGEALERWLPDGIELAATAGVPACLLYPVRARLEYEQFVAVEAAAAAVDDGEAFLVPLEDVGDRNAGAFVIRLDYTHYVKVVPDLAHVLMSPRSLWFVGIQDQFGFALAWGDPAFVRALSEAFAAEEARRSRGRLHRHSPVSEQLHEFVSDYSGSRSTAVQPGWLQEFLRRSGLSYT
jgi:hypothetical protein